MSEPILQTRDLHAAYGEDEILHGLDLALKPGEMVSLLGPNGSGKSTLLRVLAGLLPASAGQITLAGRSLHSYDSRHRARLVALVPQYATIPFAFSVLDIVAMGRHPYLGLLESPGARDFELINAALARTDCSALRDRLVTELSGGELQRVIIARALVQEPRVLLLDEPTAHLDLRHQLDIARLLRQLNLEEGLTVLWVSHDLNLAAEFCPRLLLLKNGALVADGPPGQVVTARHLAEVYDLHLPITQNPLSGRPQVILSGSGETP